MEGAPRESRRQEDATMTEDERGEAIRARGVRHRARAEQRVLDVVLGALLYAVGVAVAAAAYWGSR
jgi:hypothetical protein